MQAESPQCSSKSIQDQATNDLKTQLLENPKQEGHDWISGEFNRLPYQLYKCWLVLSFGVLLATGFGILYILSTSEYLLGDGVTLIGLILILYGYGEMFWGIMKRKSRLAQQGFSKSNSGTVIFLVLFLLGLYFKRTFNPYIFCADGGLLRFTLFMVIQSSHYIGGMFVVRAFKKNHPLERQRTSLLREGLEPDERDIIEQNEIIKSEALKFDQKLKTCPYVAFRCWLMLIMIFEIFFVVRCLLVVAINFTRFFSGGTNHLLSNICRFILPLPSSFPILYSCFQIEAAIRKKTLAQSQRSLKALKVGIVISGIVLLVNAITFPLPDIIPLLVLFLVIPVVTFIGAVYVHKFLEQRDQIAKFSNYNGDSYL